MHFIEGYREANIPKRSGASTTTQEPKIPTTVKEDTRWSNEPTDTTPLPSTTTPSGGITPSGTLPKVKTDTTTTVQRQMKVQATVVSTDGLEASRVIVEETALSKAMMSMQSDAPACTVCGATTVRSGTCYKCLECGESLGCS